MNAAVAAFPPEIRGQTPEAGSNGPEIGYRKPVVGGPKPEVRSQKPEVRVEPTDDAGEDAEVATTPEANFSPETNTAAPSSDDEGYNWPEGSAAASETAVPTAVTPEAVNAPLPSLDELVKRIPPDVRETLDDLFRVKFVAVRRVSPTSLKS